MSLYDNEKAKWGLTKMKKHYILEQNEKTKGGPKKIKKT
jgi:hypothetical protein